LLFRVWGLGLSFQGLGFYVLGFGFRVEGVRVKGLELMIKFSRLAF
jgi:hypothetical protein